MNNISICGVLSAPSFSHNVNGENFYKCFITSYRLSGACDILPVIVSECLIDSFIIDDLKVRLKGEIRTHNSNGKLLLNIFATEIQPVSELSNENNVFIDGYVCKNPINRITPSKTEITDILVASNRSFGKSDYIPCVCWNRAARFSASFGVATHIHITGRMQSRIYQKDGINKTAYEISVISVEKLE